MVKEGRVNCPSNNDGAIKDRFGRQAGDERRRRRSELLVRKPSADFFDDIFSCNDIDVSRSALTHSRFALYRWPKTYV